MSIGQVWNWLHDRDWKTWLGHLAQAVAIMLVGVPVGGLSAGLYANSVHWGLREGPGIVQAVRAGDTRKIIDGFGDLAGPLLGIALFALVRSLIA